MSTAPAPPPATPPDDPLGPPVRRVAALQPLHWLQRGWADLMASPLPGLVHGAAAFVFGLSLLAAAGAHFWVLAGAFSGFLIVAPIVATGLYEVSRALGRREPGTLADAMRVWRRRDPRLVRFGLLLALAGTGWVMTSASLVTGFAGEPVRGPADFVRVVVLAPGSWLFEAWLVLGALLAAPVFASSVVAMPMMLDRPGVTLMQAVLTGWRVVMASPVALGLWAALILALTVAAMLTGLVGLLVVVPVLAHASWHAYCDLVEPAVSQPGADAGRAVPPGPAADPGAGPAA